MPKHKPEEWSTKPPDSEGFWWLYGDEEFGTMGGNYTGAYPPEIRLRFVDVKRIGGGEGHLIGVASGRMIELRPFDAERRRPGFIGVWRKVDLPILPNGN